MISPGSAALIYEQSGIKLGAEKKIMLESRLRRRMAQPEIELLLGNYCDYVFRRRRTRRARDWSI